MPYLNAWYDKYNNQGLQIISIHSPEFDFEKNQQNVADAVKQYGIKYPVVLDNNYGTWNAYQNRYWPHKYLIDIDGFVVYDHIGEGSYEETERKIQELLKERQTALGTQEKISTDIARPNNTETVDDTLPQTPETYFGAARNVQLGNGPRGQVGSQTFGPPPSLSNDIFYLLGTWNIQPEYAESGKNAGLTMKYRAGKVFLVAGAAHPVTVRVLRDGKPLGDERGRDVAPDSTVTIQENRLYRLIEDPSGYGEHTITLEIEQTGLQIYTFTFG